MKKRLKSKEEFDKQFDEWSSFQLQGGHVQNLTSMFPIEQWSDKQLAIGFNTIVMDSNDKAYAAIVAERTKRESRRLFYISLSASIIIPLISLFISIWFTQSKLEIDKAWMEKQNKIHLELIKKLKAD